MKRLTRETIIRVAPAVIAVTLMMPLMAHADDAGGSGTKPITYSSLVQNVAGGKIDWARGMMYASAEAPMQPEDKQPNRARAYLGARDFAKMEAISRLLAVVEGTTVTYQGSGKDLMDQDAGLRRTIEGYINNVEIVSIEKIQLHGADAVRVTVGTEIYGEATPGSAFLDNLAGSEKAKQPPLIELPDPVPATIVVDTGHAAKNPDEPASSRPPDAAVEFVAPPAKGPYTSLIVDTRGYSMQQAISPKVRKPNGDLIYGILGDKSDPAIRQGTVSYALTLDGAYDCAKCGNNPLIVRAVGRGGGKSMCDVIVSDRNAGQILKENRISGFLDGRKVIFIVDRPGEPTPTSG